MCLRHNERMIIRARDWVTKGVGTMDFFRVALGRADMVNHRWDTPKGMEGKMHTTTTYTYLSLV